MAHSKLQNNSYLMVGKIFITPNNNSMHRINYLILLLLFSFYSCQKSNEITPAPSIITPEYAENAQQLKQIIQQEMTDKGIPAVSIAIVDDQKLVYAEGFGFQDLDKTIPADMNSIYRIGSVSKMFTDIGIMKEMEAGNIDIDAPIQEYLPEFQPDNPFDKKISLRQLMAHRAGLVREPPVGHYFDDSGTNLKATVASLNETRLVYEPETRTKYSNAGIAVVGYTLERMKQQAFADYLQETILEPLQMNSSSFEPKEEFSSRLVEAKMWTYDGREFPAPTFELGMAPAGSMYASVTDLALYMQMLFRGGVLLNGDRLLKEESIQSMWSPQFSVEGSTSGYGLGFAIGDMDGKKWVGHGGAIYGFSTEMALLPEEKLGVVVVCSKDFSNTVMDRIAEFALKSAVAKKEGKAAPQWITTQSVGEDLAKKMAGSYRNENNDIELIARGDDLFLDGRTYKLKLKRKKQDTLTIDDCLSFGNTIYLGEEDNLRINSENFTKYEAAKPIALSSEQKEYIGEYGWDYNTLYISERKGQLHVLIEWFPMYPITPIGKDLFDFPNYGLYHGENLEFIRQENGEISGVKAAGIFFEKRLMDIEDGKTFQIEPVKPTEELRSIALSSSPPKEDGEFLEADLVDLASLDPTIKYDIRYASDNNFMGIPFYLQSKAFMQRPAAEAVVRIHNRLKEKGYGLLIHDAYRPWYVTKMFWDATPEEFKHFVANPERGSRHNRGCAVDLTLYHLESGQVIETVGGYDEFSDRSYPNYPGGTELQRYYRELIRNAMEADGFSVYEWEWWHFDYKDWRKYPIMNFTFEDLNL